MFIYISFIEIWFIQYTKLKAGEWKYVVNFRD